MQAPALFRTFAASPQGPLTDPPRGEAGADGDLWHDLSGGGPDVNPNLSGSAKFQVYDEMRKTDPTVKSTLLFQKLSARSAHWGLNPATDSPAARVVRDMVAWNLGLEGHEGELDLSWDELLQHLLTTLDFGPSLAELVWYAEGGQVARPWRDADGDAHLVRPLTRVAPRMPSSIARVERKNGRITSVVQNLPNVRPIPGEKIVHLVFEREGSRWDGVSMLRPAWGAWTLKKSLIVSTGIGWDRFSMGLPVIWHPDNPEGEERARSIGYNVRSHHRAFVRFPTRGFTDQGKPMSEYALELLNGASSIADPVNLLRWCSEQIAEGGLAHFSSLGRTGTGAYSVGDVQIDPFFLAVQTLAEYIRAQVVKQIIRPLVIVNFGVEAGETLVPKLTVTKVRRLNLEQLAKALALFADAGFHLTLPGDEDNVREYLGFDPLPDDLEDRGINRARLLEILQGLGLDAGTFAAIVNALPPDVGIARNRDEGAGLALNRTAA